MTEVYANLAKGQPHGNCYAGLVSILEGSNTASLTQYVPIHLIFQYWSERKIRNNLHLQMDNSICRQSYLRALLWTLLFSVKTQSKWTLIFWTFHVSSQWSIIWIHNINWTWWARSGHYSLCPSKTMCSKRLGDKNLTMQVEFWSAQWSRACYARTSPLGYRNYYCTLQLLMLRKKHHACQASSSFRDGTFCPWEYCSNPFTELLNRLPVLSPINASPSADTYGFIGRGRFSPPADGEGKNLGILWVMSKSDLPTDNNYKLWTNMENKNKNTTTTNDDLRTLESK